MNNCNRSQCRACTQHQYHRLDLHGEFRAWPIEGRTCFSKIMFLLYNSPNPSMSSGEPSWLCHPKISTLSFTCWTVTASYPQGNIRCSTIPRAPWEPLLDTMANEWKSHEHGINSFLKTRRSIIWVKLLHKYFWIDTDFSIEFLSFSFQHYLFLITWRCTYIKW